MILFWNLKKAGLRVKPAVTLENVDHPGRHMLQRA
jgi:hypothetical protein